MEEQKYLLGSEKLAQAISLASRRLRRVWPHSGEMATTRTANREEYMHGCQLLEYASIIGS
jgi:hypothetical protein